MRTIITFIMFVAAAYAAMAQNGTQDRKLSKKERKLMEARIDSALNAEAVQAINDTAFTIEADKVEFKRGYTAHVTASTNFVAVSGSNAIVQVAFNVPVSGFNGLGGITLEGIVTGYKEGQHLRKAKRIGQRHIGAAVHFAMEGCQQGYRQHTAQLQL